MTARRLVEEAADALEQYVYVDYYRDEKFREEFKGVLAAIVALVRREVAEELREIARADPTLIDTDIGILRAAADRVERP